MLPFTANLRRLGVAARVRTVDPAQYEERMRSFDFDMAVVVIGESLSPGNEQRDSWSSASADQRGGRNLMGVKSKAVDALVDLVIAAPDRASLVTRAHALDRLLLWGFYAIPNWHISAFRIAYWDKFGRPDVAPKYGINLSSWWVDQGKLATLEAKRSGLGK